MPAASPVADTLVEALLQLYLYGDFPPVTVTVAEPVEVPLQLTEALVNANANAEGCEITTDALVVALVLSVTVTV